MKNLLEMTEAEFKAEFDRRFAERLAEVAMREAIEEDRLILEGNPAIKTPHRGLISARWNHRA